MLKFNSKLDLTLFEAMVWRHFCGLVAAAFMSCEHGGDGPVCE